jgi:hypothetical protein
MKLWYLAHPVRTDEYYSESENLEHALQVQQILHEKAGLMVINSWHSFCKIHENTPITIELMKKMFEIDSIVVEHCDGIILTGHRLSSGMQHELNVAISSRKDILDLIGIADDVLHIFALHGIAKAEGASVEIG